MTKNILSWIVIVCQLHFLYLPHSSQGGFIYMQTEVEEGTFSAKRDSGGRSWGLDEDEEAFIS